MHTYAALESWNCRQRRQEWSPKVFVPASLFNPWRIHGEVCVIEVAGTLLGLASVADAWKGSVSYTHLRAHETSAHL
eukprot:1859420-Alexandrium_andersonii.AAC.1